jgi:hypothetical protein
VGGADGTTELRTPICLALYVLVSSIAEELAFISLFIRSEVRASYCFVGGSNGASKFVDFAKLL